ncbi:MAG: phage tail assembly protein [Aliarcobacter sp.]|nr:phage tail assembly protein [Aliarcobacter sp.]
MKDITLANGKTVQMREPKVRDMRISQEAKTDAEQEIKLIGNLTNMTMDEIDELSLKDYTSLQTALKSFL